MPTISFRNANLVSDFCIQLLTPCYIAPMHEWYSNMDHGLFNIAVFLDLRKVFHTVNHEMLTKKLGFNGFDSSAVSLLSSYLINRSQMCCIDGHFSYPSVINYGIPQDSMNIGASAISNLCE